MGGEGRGWGGDTSWAGDQGPAGRSQSQSEAGIGLPGLQGKGQG